MSGSNSYTLTPTVQLVDLSGPFKNFKAHFIIETKDRQSAFLATVVTQDQLDSDTVEFNDSFIGKAEGDVTNDTENTQKYFLALKTKEIPISVDVSITREQIDQYTPPPLPQLLPPPSHYVPSEDEINVNDKFNSNLKVIVIIVIFVAVGYVFLSGGNKKKG